MMLLTARQAGHTQSIGFGFPDEGMSCNVLQQRKTKECEEKLDLGCDASATLTPEAAATLREWPAKPRSLENLGLPVDGRDLSGKLAEHAIGRIHLPMTMPILQTFVLNLVASGVGTWRHLVQGSRGSENFVAKCSGSVAQQRLERECETHNHTQHRLPRMPSVAGGVGEC